MAGINFQSTTNITLTGYASGWAERTAKNTGKAYASGTIEFTPRRATDSVELRVFASGYVLEQSGGQVPDDGDFILISGSLSSERDGGFGIGADSIQILGYAGDAPVQATGSDDDDEDDFTF